MGCLLRCFCFKSSGSSHQKKVKDDRTWKRHDSLEEKLDDDTEMAIVLSLSEQELVAQQKREGKAQLEEGSQCAGALIEEKRRQHAQANLEEDELLAKAIQESLNLEESSCHQREQEKRLCAKARLEKDEWFAKTVQNSLNPVESFLSQQEGKVGQSAKAQLEEDELLARTVHKSLNMETRPLLLEKEERNCHKAQLDEDEQLAKTIQESLAVESPVHQQGKGKTKHFKDLLEEDQLSKALQESLNVDPPLSKCTGCNSAVEDGKSLNLLDAVWHPECFRCHACEKPITVEEFSKSRGQFHKACYKEQRHPRCFVCKEKIPSTAAGAEYKIHPFWLEKYCPSHEVDGTSKCCSCERLEPKGTKYLILDDGRRLCLECLDSAIMDTDECQPLYFDIREFFEGLQMKVEKQFPLLLVERQALNKAEEEEKTDRHHAVVTRGLCLSEEQIVRSVSRGPTKGANNRLTGMATESYRLTRECEVTAILIMYGLPRLLTGSILAHEMMHAWLRLNKYRKLRPDFEEGICQVLAHMWLDTQTYQSSDVAAASSSTSHMVATTSKKGDQPEFEKRLAGLFKNQIETDESPDYGDGFRKCNQAVSQHGLKETLRSMQKTGGLPS